MTDEQNMSVEENLEAVAQASESENHNDVSEEAQQAEQQKRNDAEYNWAEMRRQMREKDQQIEDLQRQFSSFSRKPAPPEEEDETLRMGDEDIVTVGQARKLAQKMAQRVADDAIRRRDASMVDERVSLKYPDYADVVTPENIKLAEQLEPELADAIGNMDDPYKKRVSAYKLMKRLQGSRGGNEMDRQKAMANSQKPLSVNAVTKQSAIGNAHRFENGLTKDLQKQLWKEMQDIRKQA